MKKVLAASCAALLLGSFACDDAAPPKDDAYPPTGGSGGSSDGGSGGSDGGSGGTGGAGGGATGGSGTGGAGGWPDDPFSLVLVLRGQPSLEGRRVVAVARTEGGPDVTSSQTVLGGEAFVVFQGILLEGVTTAVDWSIDSDNDGYCTAEEPAGHFDYVGDYLGSFIPLDPTSLSAEACANFARPAGASLTLRGTGFEAWNGGTVRALLIDEDFVLAVARLSAPVAAGGFEIEFSGLLQAVHSHRIAWYVDLDGDERCTELAAEPYWDRIIEANAADTTFDVTPASDPQSACQNFQQ